MTRKLEKLKKKWEKLNPTTNERYLLARRTSPHQGPDILPISGMYLNYQHGITPPKEILDECPFDLKIFV